MTNALQQNGFMLQLKKKGENFVVKGLLYKFIVDYQLLDKIYIPLSPAIWMDEDGQLRVSWNRNATLTMQH